MQLPCRRPDTYYSHILNIIMVIHEYNKKVLSAYVHLWSDNVSGGGYKLITVKVPTPSVSVGWAGMSSSGVT